MLFLLSFCLQHCQARQKPTGVKQSASVFFQWVNMVVLSFVTATETTLQGGDRDVVTCCGYQNDVALRCLEQFHVVLKFFSCIQRRCLQATRVEAVPLNGVVVRGPHCLERASQEWQQGDMADTVETIMKHIRHMCFFHPFSQHVGRCWRGDEESYYSGRLLLGSCWGRLLRKRQKVGKVENAVARKGDKRCSGRLVRKAAWGWVPRKAAEWAWQLQRTTFNVLLRTSTYCKVLKFNVLRQCITRPYALNRTTPSPYYNVLHVALRLFPKIAGPHQHILHLPRRATVQRQYFSQHGASWRSSVYYL